MTILIKRLVFVTLCFSFWSVGSSKTEVEKKLMQADSLYWFAMEEGGNVKALEEGIRILEDVNASLSALPESNETKVLFNRTTALLVDLEKQHELSHDTLFGVFPMVRFLSESVFTDSLSLGTFEVADDPAVMASNSASRRLINILNRATGKYGQFDVIFLSGEKNHDLENEALYLFNQDPKFFVHNRHEMLGIFGEAYDEALYDSANNPAKPIDWDRRLRDFIGNPENARSLVDNFKNPYLLVVTLDSMGDEDSSDKFYSVSGRAWDLQAFLNPNPEVNQANALRAAATFTTYGFSRDRNHLFWPFVIGNLLLLLFVIVYYYESKKDWITTALIGSVAFLFARCWPTVAGTALTGFAPKAESLWYLAFWWPLVAFVVLLLAPFVMVKLAKDKFPQIGLLDKISFKNLAPAMTVGLLAALGSDLFVYGSTPQNSLPQELVVLLCLFAFSMSLCVKVHASCMDELKGKLPSIVLASVGLVLMAWGYFAYDSVPMAGACLVSFYAFLKSRPGVEEIAPKDEEKKPEAKRMKAQAREKKDLDWLKKQTDEPAKYCWDRATEEIRDRFRKEPNRHLVLRGESGLGKSRLAMEIAKSVGGKVEIKRGTCLQPVEGGQEQRGVVSYGLFRSLFRGQAGLFFEQASANEDTSARIAGDAFARLIPFFGLAMTGVSKLVETMPKVSGEREIEKLVKDAILNMGGERKSLILVVDDLQWIDEDSDKKLLGKLLEWEPDGFELRFIMTDREDSIASAERVKVVEVKPSPEDIKIRMEKILRESLELTESAVREIMGKTDGQSEGCLAWLLYGVREFAVAKQLEWEEKENGFAFTKLPDGETRKISAPPAMREMIERNLARHSEHREVLRHAVMLGEDFNASELTVAMGRDRLEVLAMLERAEADTGIVRDLPEKDDWFHIPSFKRQIATAYFRVQEEGPDSQKTPQVVRETHARIAKGLEELGCGNFEAAQKIADHYYFSGSSYSQQAVRSNIEVARMEADRYNYTAAKKRLENAKKYSQVGDSQIEREELILKCRIASTERNREVSEDALKDCETWLKKIPDDMDIQIWSLRTRHEVASEYISSDQPFAREKWRVNVESAKELLSDFIHRIKDPVQKKLFEVQVLHYQALSTSPLEKVELMELYSRTIGVLEGEQGKGLFYESSEEARQIYAEVLNSKAQSLLWSRDGDKESNLSDSEKYYAKSIETKKALGDWEGLAISNAGLGYLWKEKKGFGKAIEFFDEARSLNEKIGSYENVGKRYLDIAECFLELGQTENNGAERFSEAEKNLVLARDILNRGEVTDPVDLNKQWENIASLWINLAELFAGTENPAETKRSLEEAKSARGKVGDDNSSKALDEKMRLLEEKTNKRNDLKE